MEMGDGCFPRMGQFMREFEGIHWQIFLPLLAMFFFFFFFLMYVGENITRTNITRFFFSLKTLLVLWLGGADFVCLPLFPRNFTKTTHDKWIFLRRPITRTKKIYTDEMLSFYYMFW